MINSRSSSSVGSGGNHDSNSGLLSSGCETAGERVNGLSILDSGSAGEASASASSVDGASVIVTSASATGAGVAAFFPPPDRDLEFDEAAVFFCAVELLVAAFFVAPAVEAGGAGVPPALLWPTLPATPATPSPVLLHASKSSR